MLHICTSENKKKMVEKIAILQSDLRKGNYQASFHPDADFPTIRKIFLEHHAKGIAQGPGPGASQYASRRSNHRHKHYMIDGIMFLHLKA